MSLADRHGHSGIGASASAQPTSALFTGTRDPRLDFFRGIAMFIILVAHTPGNFLTLWIPARFGFSDATEIFVFCSGMASAMAFGKVFRNRSFALGSARVVYRIWQVYWAHIGMFFATAAMLAWVDSTGVFERDFIGRLNLYPFFVDNTAQQLVGLMTLTYVPNYFDVLPMYLVVLALMPVVMALSKLSPKAVFAFVGLLWLGANVGLLGVPAEPWSERTWFFNPFGWQLIFFTGFGFVMGWLPVPPVNLRLVLIALAVVILTIPLAYYRIYTQVDLLSEARQAIRFLWTKSAFGLFRYLHFLALAYLCWAAVGPRGARLLPKRDGVLARIWMVILSQIMKVGQQSLAVFVFSMVLAQGHGVLLDAVGRTTLSTWLVNIWGFLLLIACAHIAAWFKGHPWRKKPA
ncbi:MAG: OpgC domain-containing protein [Mangrovicoccus sp.]|nr:OpgC domain-containing protein [Mangrovicoccus sp.]